MIDKLLAIGVDPGRGFSAATDIDRIVFGSRRPGFPLLRVSRRHVDTWVGFMREKHIRRVVCLLPARQLAYYGDNLLNLYALHFGPGSICWVPTDDFKLVGEYELINVILPFLFKADRDLSPVVIHCSGGVGRTGQVLAAWLVAKYGLSNQGAIAIGRAQGRNAREARDRRLDAMLERCRQIFAR